MYHKRENSMYIYSRAIGRKLRLQDIQKRVNWTGVTTPHIRHIDMHLL